MVFMFEEGESLLIIEEILLIKIKLESQQSLWVNIHCTDTVDLVERLLYKNVFQLWK